MLGGVDVVYHTTPSLNNRQPWARGLRQADDHDDPESISVLIYEVECIDDLCMWKDYRCRAGGVLSRVGGRSKSWDCRRGSARSEVAMTCDCTTNFAI